MAAIEVMHPHALWLLAVLPLLGWWWHQRRRPAAVRFPDAEALEQLPRERASWADAWVLLVRLAVLALLILAIARPRWPDDSSRIPAEGIAIEVVLDISGSMGEEDFELEGVRMTRLEAAKRIFERFLAGSGDEFAGRKEDMVGLVTFAMLPDDVHPPTLSHASLLRTLPDIHATRPPDASTNIGDAMAFGIKLLHDARPATKVMILISDGEHTVPANEVPDALTPRAAVHFARKLGVRVHAIYTGPNPELISDEKTRENARIGEETMQYIAEQTGGRFYHADSAQALLHVWQQIDRSERTTVESFRYYRYAELYPWLGLAAIGLLAALFWLEGRQT